jgi:hypothetical protein
MDYDEQDRPGWVRLPPADEDAWAGASAVSSRAEGVRRVRRASNWTAAALIAGVAAASGYFAHQMSPATSVAGSTAQAPAAGQAPVAGPAAVAGHAPVAGPHQASGTVPVATSGGSGVATGPVTGATGTGTQPAGAATVTWRDN